MATASCQASAKMRAHLLVEHWFFTGLALAMLVTSAAGFLPSLLNAAGRRAPISSLAAAHGILFLAWLCIFLVQSRLVATENVGLHLGVAAGIVLALMIPLAYATTIAMARRGFDLSGDLFRDLVPARRIAPLFSAPMHELTDRDYEAQAVLGVLVSQLEQRFGDCRSFGERAHVADQFFLRRCVDVGGSDGISEAASQILMGGGNVRNRRSRGESGLEHAAI